MARLRDQYLGEIQANLRERLGAENTLALPRLKKITVSMGVGAAKDNKKILEHGLSILEKISGQKSVATLARKSVAQFRLREGMPVGCRVTLRGVRMYEFLDRLINVVIPRIRDFRGMNRKLDGRGNFNMGLTEQSVFPELGTELLEFPLGMNIALTISGGSDESSAFLLEEFGFPFRQPEEANVA
jgi:large subunit ribosomal protein L5